MLGIEFVNWRERAYARLNEQFNPQALLAIASDRDNAVDALRAKLEDAEKRQAMMVAANKIIRSTADAAALATLCAATHSATTS